MRIDCLTTEAAMAALVPEWEVLAGALNPWMPFATPAWNLIHWEHFRRDSLPVRDRLRVFAVRDPDGRLVAVAPMQLTVRPGYGPVAVRQLHYFGADRNVTEIRGLICRRADEAKAAASLCRHLWTINQTWDLLHWGGLIQGHPAHAHVVRHAPALIERTIPNFFVDLPDSFDALKSSLPRNTKEALRKCYNSLARDGHAFVFDVLTTPDDVDDAADDFFRLHTARAGADYGVAHPDTFADPRARHFLRDYMRHAAAHGALRVFRLRIGGETVAIRVGFLHGQELYLYYSGHLPAWGRYSVMTTVEAEALKWSIAAGITRVNLSIGRDRSKLRWRPLEVNFWEGFQVLPTPRGRLTARMFLQQRDRAKHWNTDSEAVSEA